MCLAHNFRGRSCKQQNFRGEISPREIYTVSINTNIIAESRESLENDKRTGRPVSVRTPEIIAKVRDFVAKNRNASLRTMEETLNINKETIRTILHEDLGKTKTYKKDVTDTLNDDDNDEEVASVRDAAAVNTAKDIQKAPVTDEPTSKKHKANE